jgi:hypothetical protein
MTHSKRCAHTRRTFDPEPATDLSRKAHDRNIGPFPKAIQTKPEKSNQYSSDFLGLFVRSAASQGGTPNSIEKSGVSQSVRKKVSTAGLNHYLVGQTSPRKLA